jgi:hypothetical protein
VGSASVSGGGHGRLTTISVDDDDAARARDVTRHLLLHCVGWVMCVTTIVSVLSVLLILPSSTAGLLGKIVESLYAVRPVASRHAEATRIEAALDKWYIELPEHLRLDPSSSPPHVLTLHMQYWCVVLLLHRPL